MSEHTMYISTGIAACSIRLLILVIMSVSTFKTDVILYLLFLSVFLVHFFPFCVVFYDFNI